MEAEFKRNKATTIITGILAVIFGVILIAMPKIALGVLILIFAVYLMLYGTVRIIDSVLAPRESSARALWMIVGILAVIGGLALFAYPGISAVFLAYYIAIYALVIGVFELIAGFSIHGNVGLETLAIVAGVLSVLFGLYLFVNPAMGLALLVVFLGWYSLIYGIILTVYGIMERPEHHVPAY